MRLSTVFGLAVLTGMVVQCTSPTSSAGNGSDVGNAAVVGMIVDGNGNPVKGATVRMVPVGFDARQLAKRLAKTRSLTATELRAALLAAVDSAVTDSNGQYSFDTVDTGTYNVLADSGATMAFQDSVAVEPDTQTTVPTDTLKAPGSLRGVVRLQPGDDNRKVFIIALGTFAVTSPADTSGSFALEDMAEGSYSVRLMSTLDYYGVLDTSFAIAAGVENALTDSIELPYTGIPVPKGLMIDYDTLKQIVTLSWNKPTTGRAVEGYNIYRQHQDSTSFQKIAGVVADTFFVDSTAEQDKTYEYRIAALDTNGTEGVHSAVARVRAIAAYELTDSLGVGLFQGYQVFKVAPSQELYVADIMSGSWKIYVFDSTLNLLRTIDTISAKYPASFDLDSAGNIYLANQNGIFKLDSNASLLDTIALLANSDNKNLVVEQNIIFVANDALRKYSTNGDSLAYVNESPLFRADGELIVWNNSLCVTGQQNKIRIYDFDLHLLNEWMLDFKDSQFTRIVAKDGMGRLFVMAYSSSPRINSILVYDSSLTYTAKLSLDGLPRDVDTFQDKLLIGNTGKIDVYLIR